jgi:phosphohistidine swiveling domain-containing protein
MPRLPTDIDRYGDEPASVLVAAVHAMLRDRLRHRWDSSGLAYTDFIAERDAPAITPEDIAAIDAAILAAGHRYAFSAVISAAERPAAYAGSPGEWNGFAHPDAPQGEPDAEGRALTGVGDNVVRRPANIRGRALHVRSSADVIALMERGVPEGSIAVIDDSGGTLTAPILERFAGVLCAGGTVRSHLGILTREYGIPCLMNVKLAGVAEGDLVELETSAPARTAESYQRGEAMPARIWRIAA